MYGGLWSGDVAEMLISQTDLESDGQWEIVLRPGDSQDALVGFGFNRIWVGEIRLPVQRVHAADLFNRIMGE